MAIRLRRTGAASSAGEGLLALCAARSIEQPGDLYLDDEAHMALARKVWLDYPELGIAVDDDVRAATAREESNNPNRADWDRMFGGGEEE